jgi:hypothetical protein
MTETNLNRTDGMHNHERDITTTTFRMSQIDDDLFARELDYQASMSIAEGLLQREILIDGEFDNARVLLLTLYRPPIGELLAEAG